MIKNMSINSMAYREAVSVAVKRTGVRVSQLGYLSYFI